MKNDGGMIAYCVPTYNHPDVVRDVLQKCGAVYGEYGIDIYYYDSSPSQDTCQVIQEFREQGMHHIHYIKIDSTISLDEKIILILSGYGLKRTYQYIWPAKDRSFVSKDTVREICAKTEQEYDVIFLGACQYPNHEEGLLNESDFYNQPQEFYKEWGWLATSIDVSIFHFHSLLENMDWDDFRQRYFFDGSNGFDHFCALFHSLAGKEQIRIKVLSGNNIACHNSDEGSSSWRSAIFNIWGKLWIEINEALPECYDAEKAITIKKATMLPWIFGSYDNMISLEQEGILTATVLEQLEPVWGRLSEISYEELYLILSKKYSKLKWVICERINKLFFERDYTSAIWLYLANDWIKRMDENGEYFLLGECFNIYLREKENGSTKGIFFGITDYYEVFLRYYTVRRWLRRLEFDIMPESWKEMESYIRNNYVSSQFLMQMIEKKCVDKEKIINNLLTVLEHV